MARPFTLAQRNTLARRRFHVFNRILVENGSGTMVDYTSQWLRAGWSLDIDNIVSGGSAEFVRGTGTRSLAPQVEPSLWNRDDDGVYAPWADGNRNIIVMNATVNPGTVPAFPADYRELFTGKIDEVDPASGERTVVTFRDLGARLLDKQIERRRKYGSVDGVPVQTVMQAILDDNPLATGPVSLVVRGPVGWPDWDIREYEQQRVKVLEALQTLAEQAGGTVRYLYDASGVSRLTLFRPDRDKVTSDWELGTDEHFGVEELKVGDTTIRNIVHVDFYDRYSGERRSAEYAVDASIGKYDRRYMEINEEDSSNIDSVAEALDMATSAAKDLAWPKASHRARTMLFWPVELSDLGGWKASPEHYTDDQQFGTVAIQHEVSPADGRTTIMARGNVAGVYDRWLRKENPNGDPPDGPPMPEFSELFMEESGFGGETGDGYAWFFAKYNKSVRSIVVMAEEGDSVDTTPAPDQAINSTSMEFVRPEGFEEQQPDFETLIPIATRPGRARRIRAFGLDANGVASAAWTPAAKIAQDPSPTPIDGDVSAFTAAFDTFLVDMVNLTINVGTIETNTATPGNFLVVMRDKAVVAKVFLGYTGSRTIFLQDRSLNPNTTYTYEAFIWNNGVSGRARRFIVGRPSEPTDTRPRFVANTPRVIAVDDTLKVYIESTASTPGGVATILTSSVDNWRTTRTVGFTGSLSPALFFDPDLGPKSYRLWTQNAGATLLEASDPVAFPGYIPPSTGGGPGEAPEFRLDVELSGFPRMPTLYGYWSTSNILAQTGAVQESDDNGVTDPWVEVPNTRSVVPGTGKVALGSPYVNKWYRYVLFNFSGVLFKWSGGVQWTAF
jgi:hypothetical protein